MGISTSHFMLQTIEESTRIENTLDLMFTNEISLITMVEVNNSNHSDHNKIEISTNYTTTKLERNNERNEETNVFKTLNFYAKSVNWNNIIRCIEDTNWDKKFETKDSIQNNEEFLEIITNNASENAPKRRQQGNNRKMPKERKRLHNRLKMLKREKHRAYSKERKD